MVVMARAAFSFVSKAAAWDRDGAHTVELESVGISSGLCKPSSATFSSEDGHFKGDAMNNRARKNRADSYVTHPFRINSLACPAFREKSDKLTTYIMHLL